MKKIIVSMLAIVFLGTAAVAQPAQARCWWDGYHRHCSNPHAYWRHHYWHRYGYRY